MTLKEKVEKVIPENVSVKYMCGVYGCPIDYSFLNDKSDCNIFISDKKCAECWNREYKEADTI